MLTTLILLACTGSTDDKTPSDSSGVTDDSAVAADDSAVDTSADPDALNGTRPENPVALPTFAAVNEQGEGRSQEDVLGTRHVLWFFPAAGTYG